jgi:hypothetical protein
MYDNAPALEPSPWLAAEDDVDTGQYQCEVAYPDLGDEFVEQAAIDNLER